MKTEKYTNSYGDEYTFTLQDDGNIKWEQNVTYCRYGFDKDPNVITMIDPSGGPFISVGSTQMGMRVIGLEKMDTGYLILTEAINKKNDKRNKKSTI